MMTRWMEALGYSIWKQSDRCDRLRNRKSKRKVMSNFRVHRTWKICPRLCKGSICWKITEMMMTQGGRLIWKIMLGSFGLWLPGSGARSWASRKLLSRGAREWRISILLSLKTVIPRLWQHKKNWKIITLRNISIIGEQWYNTSLPCAGKFMKRNVLKMPLLLLPRALHMEQSLSVIQCPMRREECCRKLQRRKKQGSECIRERGTWEIEKQNQYVGIMSKKRMSLYLIGTRWYLRNNRKRKRGRGGQEVERMKHTLWGKVTVRMPWARSPPVNLKQVFIKDQDQSSQQGWEERWGIRVRDHLIM